MRQLSLLLFLVLAACAPKLTATDGNFRNPSAPIYSIAGFDFARLEGRWDQAAAFSTRDAASCQRGGASFSSNGGTLSVKYNLCLSGDTVTGAGTVTPTGPGRFAVSGAGGLGTDWWVLWVDESYRTLAIGHPDGGFGFILNRGDAVPADRLAAAREVLDFNGYAKEKLVVFGR